MVGGHVFVTARFGVIVFAEAGENALYAACLAEPKEQEGNC